MSITTDASWSQHIHDIRVFLDKALAANPNIKKFPPLRADLYDTYREAVLKISPHHSGSIYYKGVEIVKAGEKPVKFHWDNNIP